MNRRTFLAVAPTAVTMPPIAALADEGTSPIMMLFREYQRLTESAQGHVCVEDDEDGELERLFYSERDLISERMLDLPCTCAADFAAKLIVDTCQGMLFSEWDTGGLWREARALVEAPTFMVAQ